MRQACIGVVILDALAGPSHLWACAVCFGENNPNIIQGYNWGILILLVATSIALGGLSLMITKIIRDQAARDAG